MEIDRYFKALGVEYFYESQPILASANRSTLKLDNLDTYNTRILLHCQRSLARMCPSESSKLNKFTTLMNSQP